MVEWWHVWVLVGIGLWIAEVFTPGFVAGVIGTACLVVAPFAGAGLSFKVQLFVFGMATLAMAFGVRPRILRHFRLAGPNSQTNVDALIGGDGLVTEAIDPKSGTGQVKIGGENWRAVTPDETRVDVGARVRVRAVEGCKVVVQVAPSTERRSL
ncbi:MAG TPA: NfeD family protein [Candidatus Paceibacterota bacterium]|nr:NfeD family protein [Verrucomicrobiota bacterium]HRZ43598.1 NfeD family protein [Candidatus Paceibacterota bacterium]HRZ91603.1 NfeD family protein [Candidatus Paceibacterota bacterium]